MLHFTINQSIAKILTFQIERGNVDGTNRMILVNHLSYPWGLAVYGPFLYYSDEEYEVIERVDKATGANKIVLRNNLPDLRGLKIYQRRGEYLSLKHTFMCVQWIYLCTYMSAYNPATHTNLCAYRNRNYSKIFKIY